MMLVESYQCIRPKSCSSGNQVPTDMWCSTSIRMKTRGYGTCPWLRSVSLSATYLCIKKETTTISQLWWKLGCIGYMIRCGRVLPSRKSSIPVHWVCCLHPFYPNFHTSCRVSLCWSLLLSTDMHLGVISSDSHNPSRVAFQVLHSHPAVVTLLAKLWVTDVDHFIFSVDWDTGQAFKRQFLTSSNAIQMPLQDVNCVWFLSWCNWVKIGIKFHGMMILYRLFTIKTTDIKTAISFITSLTLKL